MREPGWGRSGRVLGEAAEWMFSSLVVRAPCVEWWRFRREAQLWSVTHRSRSDILRPGFKQLA